MGWGALILSTLGVLAVVEPGRAALSPDLWRGNLILVAAAVSWALFSVLVRKVTMEIPSLPFTFIGLMGGLLVALPLAGWELSNESMGPITVGIIAGVLFLGLISTALAFYLWNLAFESLEAGMAALTFFAQPLVGASLGVVFLGEQLTPMFLVGGVLILLGIYLGARPNTKAI